MPICSLHISQIYISTRIYDQLFPCIFVNIKVVKLLIAANLIIEKGYSTVVFIFIFFTMNVVDTQHSLKSFKHTFIHCRGWITIRNIFQTPLQLKLETRPRHCCVYIKMQYLEGRSKWSEAVTFQAQRWQCLILLW